ncbi:MAG: hypothetical protein M1818_005104 [Claussenomyces sp. TS43310]|nr:MAG: hypothetical protein M1818_005104 [Claussenomyces sp. TS43310]
MEWIKNSIAENFGGSTYKLAKPQHQFELGQVPDQSGKNIEKLFILSISQEIVDGALKYISDEFGPDAAKKVTWLNCDMSDWPTVTSCADKIVSQADRLDILINNAGRGIMTYQLTDYGVDRHMAVNHFGHVVLTSHLMPLLKKTANDGNIVRIVALGSNAHRATPSDYKFSSLSELNRDLGPNGFVSTKMSQEDIHEPYPLAGYALSVGAEVFKKDQFQGCVSAMFAATKADKSGEYICSPAIPEGGNQLAQSEELQENLVKLTTEVIKEKMYDQSVGKGCPLHFN